MGSICEMRCKSTRAPCKLKATHHYDGKNMCSVHLKSYKANEDCPICYAEMNSGSRIDACGNGHYYHVNCLFKWVTADSQMGKRDHCPTCSTVLPAKTLVKIYKKYDEFRMEQLYTLDPNKYRSISTIFDKMIQCNTRELPNDLSYLVQSFYQVASMPQHSRSYVINEFHAFVQSIIAYQTQ